MNNNCITLPCCPSDLCSQNRGRAAFATKINLTFTPRKEEAIGIPEESTTVNTATEKQRRKSAEGREEYQLRADDRP